MQKRRKQSTTLEWQIAGSDREWAQLCQPPVPAGKSQRGLLRRLAEVLLLIVGLSSAGGWHWYTTQAEFQQAQAELTATVQQEGQLAPPTQSATGPAQAELAALIAVEPKLPSAKVVPTVRVLALQGDQVIVTVVTPPGTHTPAYRQTQFYHRTSVGWQRTAPDATLWGPPQELETASFHWHYRQNDAQVVATAAPQIEAIYTTLLHNFGLVNAPPASKLSIEVSVTQPVGYVSPWFGAADAYVVSSPALYLAPIELTDAELLVQSLALPLFNTVIAQAREHYRLHASWQPLLNGLRLWQLWELDLPLSPWRGEIVGWLYGERARADAGQRVGLPAHYADLCAAHTLWLPSPQQINIPLACTELDRQVGYFAPLERRNRMLHLPSLGAPTAGAYADPSVQEMGQRGQTVALATLIEYAVTVYGWERLPVLVASLQEHKSWETLLPAVYGVSALEFEAGWLEFLAAHYGG